jgi:hypothetical protein
VIVEYRGAVETDADPEAATIVLFVEQQKEKYLYEKGNPSNREYRGGHPYLPADGQKFLVEFVPDGAEGEPAKPVTAPFTADKGGLLVIKLPPEVREFGAEELSCHLEVTSVEAPPLTPKKVKFESGAPTIGKQVLGLIYLNHGGTAK